MMCIRCVEIYEYVPRTCKTATQQTNSNINRRFVTWNEVNKTKL